MNASNIEYSKYEKCIQKLVWRYVKQSRFDYDELLSEANLGFLHAVETFDKNKSGMHTHCFITVNGRLQKYCAKPERIESDLDELASPTLNPEQNAIFSDLIENLSKEAREVVETILETPKEMIELVKEMSASRQGHMHVYRSNVTRYFKDLGWKRKKILKAYSEIRSTFNMG